MSRVKNVALFAVSGIALAALSASLIVTNGGEVRPGSLNLTAFVREAVAFIVPPFRERTLTKESLLESTDKLVGTFSQSAPYSDHEYHAYIDAAGGAPNAIALFTKWDSPFRADGADRAYKRGAIPVVTWESWEQGSAIDDPDYELDVVLSGDYDDYIRTFARDVARYDRLVMIRLNHEMNGDWYPWGVGMHGNTPEKYVAMWQKVHDVFVEEGADNVAWIWGPNAYRGQRERGGVRLADLYPGDAYVDYVGLSGYAKVELTATELYQPTIDIIREFTAKPVFLAEIGAMPYDGKTDFIKSLFTYVNTGPDIVGFMWFQTSVETGANNNWAFDDTEENAAEYRSGVANTPLTPLRWKGSDSVNG